MDFKVPKFEEKKKEDKFIIIHTKDLENDDYNLLKRYGKVDAYQAYHAGLSCNELFNKLNLDYLTIDINNKLYKSFFEGIPNKEDYLVVAIISKIQDYTTFYNDLEKITRNILHKLPNECAFKNQFDQLLLMEKLHVPNDCCSCLSFLVNFQDSMKKSQP
jgi:hypothetical protein